MKKEYYFIVNPHASSGKSHSVWKQVKQVLQSEKIDYKVFVPKTSAEAESRVRALTIGGQRRHIVVLGGDGTLNAVLNGIVDFDNTIISCIRTGSGNDFARNVRIEKNATKAVKHLLEHPQYSTMDYGEITFDTENEKKHRRFLISSGMGYDADICVEASRSRMKRLLNRVGMGKLVYVLIGIKQIFLRKNVIAQLWLDDKEINVPKMFFVVGMIHEKEGGGVPFCPSANAKDGLLDVCLVDAMPKWKLLLAVIMVYLRKHTLFQGVTIHRCKKMCVKTENKQWFHMDGETTCKIRKMELQCKNGLHFCK